MAVLVATTDIFYTCKGLYAPSTNTRKNNLHDYCVQLFALIRSILKADDSIYRQITDSDTIVQKYPSRPIKIIPKI